MDKEQEEQLKKPIIPTDEVVDDDDDEGPPPGFQCIITPHPQPQADEKDDDDDEEDDEGPPPGFDSIAPKPLAPPSLLTSHDMANSSKEDDDDDGPPPGWEFSALTNALPKPQSNMTDTEPESNKEIEDDEDEDDGPPPGWEMVLPHQKQLTCTTPLQPSSVVSCDTEMGSKQKIARNDEAFLPSGSQSVPMPVQPLLTPLPSQQQPSSEVPSDMMNKTEETNGGKRPMSGNQHAIPPKQLLSPITPPLAPSSSEKAQLVCGTCRKLCLFPRGAKWVKCPGCQEVNFALEAHEVGQVKCGGCAMLLMYPHGAPAVQCSTCRCVTQIGAHNQRPPLSVQQAQRRRRLPRRAR